MRVEHRCPDGSRFPVEFADAADAERCWRVDLEHTPRAMTPLADAVKRAGHDGAERAYEECGLAYPSSMRHEPPRANGFNYFLDLDLPSDEHTALTEGLARLARANGWTEGFWSGFCVPRLRSTCDRLDGAPVDASFRVLAERCSYIWSLTGVAGIMARRDEKAVAESCAEQFGDRATFVAFQLAQGHENETLSADRALLELAQLDPGSAEAHAAREAFSRTYGGRTSSWPIDHPTSREQPAAVDAQLRLLRGASADDLDSRRRDAVARRRALATEISARLTAEERHRFEQRVARLSSFVPVREARAHWQLLASGAMRGRVRASGRDLCERGVIAAPDDVFFLTPDEFDQPPDDVRDAVTERRAEHAHWLTVSPPVSVGACAHAPVPGPHDRVLRGAAGSPGTARGRARVILDLVDADRLEPGDILVTTMTSPPWTPLFVVAGAVVTDSGDALSHVAIAAREYGIPCVVATHDATTRVRDGSQIVVDGGSGTVDLDG